MKSSVVCTMKTKQEARNLVFSTVREKNPLKFTRNTGKNTAKRGESREREKRGRGGREGEGREGEENRLRFA